MAAADPASMMGRFRLIKSLGEGAQATVWLAHDPRLDREVALKVLRPGNDGVNVDEWLHEARAVSRLTHPNIVPVFEADVGQSDECYMVFEFVPGMTLAERLTPGKPLAARKAVELMLGVLDALQAAHAAGVVHRDLKPSNILIDAAGRARVMDFGIAARLADAAALEAGGGRDDNDDDASAWQAGEIVGTPGYISPEAARGDPPSALMDVFACAVMLAEMISGTRMNASSDPWQAVRRVIETDFVLPQRLPADVDDSLRAIVQRGLARDAGQRWPSAQALHAALQHWLAPVHTPVTAAAAPASGGGATLDFLLRRMRGRGDFPALAASAQRIQRLSLSDQASLAGLASEVLNDVALTHKLLRLVNTAGYRHAGGGSITTVSRATSLLGFTAVRNMATGLVQLDHMRNQDHVHLLHVDYLRSMMAAHLARELCRSPLDDEEAYVCALFHHLGRSLTEYYFPEEAEQIRRISHSRRPGAGGGGATALEPALIEQHAAAQVLGLSFEQLGVGVARQWGLPKALQQSMHHPIGHPPTYALDPGIERRRWLAHAASSITDTLLHSEPDDAWAQVRAIGLSYARALSLTPDSLQTAVDRARNQVVHLVAQMQIRLPADSPAHRLLQPLVEPAPSLDEDDSLTPHQLQATLPLPLFDETPAPAAAPPASAASAGHAGNAAEPTQVLPRVLTRENDAYAATLTLDRSEAMGERTEVLDPSQRPAPAEPGVDLDIPLTPPPSPAPTTSGTPASDAPPDISPARRLQVAAALAAGVQDITNRMVEDFQLQPVLQLILTTIHRGLGLRRVVLCLRDARHNRLVGCFGLGAGVEPEGGLVAAFRIPLVTARGDDVDLFSAVCQRGVDTLIADATDPKLAERLPLWYRARVRAPTFLLLPIMLKGAAVGLIYADQSRPGAIQLDERELGLLRTLRNQAVMAFRQAG
jgi:HD-like signal output (HDOD) protein